MGIRSPSRRVGVSPLYPTGGIPSLSDQGIWESVMSSQLGARQKKLVHIICHRTYLVKGKVHLFIDDFSDTKETYNFKNQLKTTNRAS